MGWLEHAAELDANDAVTQAELGFAYSRTGQPASGLRAFERSAGLDSSNMIVQTELGTLYGARDAPLSPPGRSSARRTRTLPI